MNETLKELLGKLDEARKAGDLHAALILAEKVKAAFPNDVRGHIRVGQLLTSLNRVEEACNQIKTSLQSFEDHPVLLGLLANAYRILGDIDAALELATELHRHEASASSYARLADLNIRKQEIERAARIAEEGLREFPDDFALLTAASNALRQTGALELALRHGRAARDSRPNAPGGYVSEAMALFELRQFRDALGTAQAGLKQFPSNSALLRIAFRSCLALEENEQALAYAEQRVAEAPHAGGCHVDLVQIAVKANKLSLAAGYAEKALSRFPDNRALAHLQWVIKESSQPNPPELALPAATPSSRSVKYIFSIPFNIKRFESRPELSDPKTGRLSETWISYRIRIFMNYTCKSLLNQSNQNFDALLLCDPSSLELVNREINKYYPLPHNIRVISGNEHSNVLSELMNGYEHYCHTKLDSDNMYHRLYVEHLHRYVPKPDTKFLAFTKGYAFDANSGTMALYRATREYLYARVGRVENWKSDANIPQPIGLSDSARETPHELIHEPSTFIITCHDINVSNKASMVHPTRTIFDPSTLADVWEGFTGDRTIYTLPAAGDVGRADEGASPQRPLSVTTS